MPQQEFFDQITELLPRLRRFGHGLSGSRETADDLVQAACEKALRTPGKWEQANYLEPWLYRTMRNLYLDQVRRNQVASRHRDHQRSEHYPEASPSPDRQVVLAQVRELVEQLPLEQKQVLLMVCVEGYSYREVGALLELPIGTVTSRLARARARLLEMLGPEQLFGPEVQNAEAG